MTKERNPMAEYIKREAAIKGVKAADLCVLDEYDLIKAINDIPAADVRPAVRGKWKHGVCQTCFFDWSGVAPFASVPNFCPDCGAKMIGGDVG